MRLSSGGREGRSPSSLLALVFAAAPIALGAMVLLGWYTGNRTLIQVSPAFVPMQYNTALGFLTFGVGFWLAQRGRSPGVWIFGGITAAIGVLTLVEYVFGVDLLIDQLFMKHYITVATSNPGRMAPNTALCFTLSGLGLLATQWARKSERAWPTAAILGSLVFGLGFVAFSGYAAAIETAYGWGKLTKMAVHTSVGFIAIGIGVVAFAWSRSRAKSSVLPNWFPASVGLGILTVAVSAWQAFQSAPTLRVAGYSVLAFGVVLSFIVSLMVHYFLKWSNKGMEDRRRFLLLIVIMAVVASGVTTGTLYVLYGSYFEQNEMRLRELVVSQARLIEAVARFDRLYSQKDVAGGSAAATLGQVKDAYRGHKGFGETGEFTVGRWREGQIEFLLLSRHPLPGGESKRVSPGEKRAEPMQRALRGESGTMVGLDYRGVEVLAAYEPVAVLDVGIVAKSDISEIRAPFVRAGFTAATLALALIVLGAAAFRKVTNPLIERLESAIAEQEGLVEERTRELQRELAERREAEENLEKKIEEMALLNQEMERFNRLAVGRELVMIELKKEINDLRVRLGQKPEYEIVE